MTTFDFDDSSSSSSSEDDDDEEEEEYTYVTRRNGPNNLCSTRVYCDGIEQKKKVDSKSKSEKKSVFCSIFDISPARCSDDSQPASDFLRLCNLCKKKLHGKDIYIYRGEKGFCSPECRHRQIVMDEKRVDLNNNNNNNNNKVSSRTSSSSSAYSNLQIILSPEIFAT